MGLALQMCQCEGRKDFENESNSSPMKTEINPAKREEFKQNAQEMQENAKEMQENAKEMQNNAKEMQENAKEMQRNSIKGTSAPDNIQIEELRKSKGRKSKKTRGNGESRKSKNEKLLANKLKQLRNQVIESDEMNGENEQIINDKVLEKVIEKLNTDIDNLNKSIQSGELPKNQGGQDEFRSLSEILVLKQNSTDKVTIRFLSRTDFELGYSELVQDITESSKKSKKRKEINKYDKQSFLDMYDNLFPDFAHEFKIIVAIIDGKIVGQQSLIIDQQEDGLKSAYINALLINPNHEEYQEEIKYRLKFSLEQIASVSGCKEVQGLVQMKETDKAIEQLNITSQ